MKNTIKKFSKTQQHNSSQEISSSIKFKRKKTKYNVRIGGKFIAFFILAGVSGAFFSNVIMNIRYGDIAYQAKVVEKSNNMFISDYSKIIKLISPSLVTISGEEKKLIDNSYYEGNCTGIILDKSGVILTSYSKIKELKEIFVKISSKGVMPVKAMFISGDEEMDIAIIRMEYSGNVTPVKFSENTSIEEGQEIAILSNSIGDEYIGKIVPGMITSTKADIKVKELQRRYRLIEMTAPVNKENDIGAVCNSKGELIGIASEKMSNEKSLNGLYYAIDVKDLEKIINSTNIFKSVLGITGGGIIHKSENDISGFYVENVIKGGNAYDAGIKPTDIIFKIDDKDIENNQDIIDILMSKKSGDILKCKVKRNDEVNDVNIVLQ